MRAAYRHLEAIVGMGESWVTALMLQVLSCKEAADVMYTCDVLLVKNRSQEIHYRAYRQSFKNYALFGLYLFLTLIV